MRWDVIGAEGWGGSASGSRAWKGAFPRNGGHFRRAPDCYHWIGRFCFTSQVRPGSTEHPTSTTSMTLHDKFGRQITDLRISITDRCNFRCVYCRSADPENYRDHDEILSWPELDRLAKIFLSLGIRKIRITGGEPLVRDGVEDYLARLHSVGVEDLSMTTNGHLLAERCDRLIAAGLRRINISLDSLDADKFERITRTKSFATVMHSIATAQRSRLAPAKVNAVLVRATNDDEVEAFVSYARETGVIMRFIEFMPLDADRHWTRSLVVTAAEVHHRIHDHWPLEQVPHKRSETARKYRFA